MLLPILKKYSFFEKFLQLQAEFLINLFKTAGFLIGPIFFRAYLENTLYIYIYIHIYACWCLNKRPNSRGVDELIRGPVLFFKTLGSAELSISRVNKIPGPRVNKRPGEPLKKPWFLLLLTLQACGFSLILEQPQKCRNPNFCSVISMEVI